MHVIRFNNFIKYFLFGLIFLQFLLWSIFTPIFEASDESGYYEGIRWATISSPLMDLTNLPASVDEVGVLIHGPLYYWMMLPLARLLPMPRWTESQPLTTPTNEARLVRFRQGVYNSYLHRYEERLMAWNDLEFSVHILRLESMISGLIIIFLVFKLAQFVFGIKSSLPYWCLLFVGMNPMVAHIFTGLTVIHTLALLYSLFWYLILRYHQRIVAQIGMGIVGGLAIMAKTTGLLILPLGLWLLMLLQPLKQAWKSGWWFILGFLVSGGYYLYRFIQLYGSILPLKVFYSVTYRRGYFFKIRVGMFNYIYDWFTTQLTTFWSGFGYQAIHLPKILLLSLFLLMFLSAWGIIIFLRFDLWKLSLEKKRWWLALISGWAIFAIGLFQAHLRFPAFHAKDMYPALIPITILWAMGIRTWIMAASKKLAYLRFFGFILGIGIWYWFSKVQFIDLWHSSLGGFRNFEISLLGMLLVKGLLAVIIIRLGNLLLNKLKGKLISWMALPLVGQLKLIMILGTILFLSNATYLVTTVTPMLYGDRNVPLTTWREQQNVWWKILW